MKSTPALFAAHRGRKLSSCSMFVPWLIAALTFHAPILPARDWSSARAPSAGPSRAIGQTANGCVGGAAELPADGPGYMVMHRERRRYYGHPNLIEAIQTLGAQMQRRGIGKLQVGDLSQARGGPMPFGHRSHQSGLDVDIWFNLDPRVYAKADALRANILAPSMLNPGGRGVNRALWSQHHVEMLELAARLPVADRIFVNPHIKRALCDTVRRDRSWLRKIRPWYYHDDHFHLRLNCPADSPSCEPQDAVPPGDGCDASLDWWLEHLPPGPPTPPAHPAPRPRLPAQCAALLEAE